MQHRTDSESGKFPNLAEARRRTRYVVPLSPATFLGAPVLIRNVSEGGIGLQHPDIIRVGAVGTMKVEVPELRETVYFRCRILWSRLSRITDAKGKFQFHSGLRIEDDANAVAGFLGRLIRHHGAVVCGTLEEKRRALEAREAQRASRIMTPQITYTPDQILLIQEAQRWIANHPLDAAQLYERAKGSFAAKFGPSMPLPYRRDVLTAWEYLGGKIDIALIELASDAAKL